MKDRLEVPAGVDEEGFNECIPLMGIEISTMSHRLSVRVGFNELIPLMGIEREQRSNKIT